MVNVMKIFHRIDDVCVFINTGNAHDYAAINLLKEHPNWFNNARVEYYKSDNDFPFNEEVIIVGNVIPNTTRVVGNRILCDINYTLYSKAYDTMRYSVSFKFRGFHPIGIERILISNL